MRLIPQLSQAGVSVVYYGMMPRSLLILALVGLAACRPTHRLGAPMPPPDPAAANPTGWVDLIPRMGLRIESAYFKSGAPRTVANYLGTETAEFVVRERGGLRLLPEGKPLANRPPDQPAAADLLPAALRGFPRLRFYYAVVFRRQSAASAAVLLGARNTAELERLSAQLASEPDAVCGPSARQCVVLPANATASPQMEITVNGVPRRVVFGGQLHDVIPNGPPVQLERDKVLTLDSTDPGVRRMPLRPGDRLRWQ